MTERDPVRAALVDEWDRYIAPGGGKRDYITPDLIDRTIKALRAHLPTRPNPDMAGCICCANGNDIPDGEYCRACGREGKTTPLGAAVMRARGKDGPPSAPVQFDSPALPPTLNSGAVDCDKLKLIETIIYENASVSHFGNESEVDNAAYLAREIVKALPPKLDGGAVGRDAIIEECAAVAERWANEAAECMITSAPTIQLDIFIAGDLAKAKQICREHVFEVGLCVTVAAVDYIYTGGEESGVRVGLINYPRFPVDALELENKAYQLAQKLMFGLCQHSFSIVGRDKTEWFSRRPEGVKPSPQATETSS